MLAPNAKGEVKNECDEMVTPQLLPVDLGANVGRALLVAMNGGPKLATCYGDGPGLTLFRNVSGAWKQIYSSRGGFLVIMKDAHKGAPDIVFGGPGFSHPVYEWTGTSYEPAKREVADERLADAVTTLP
jgi:hypothetical protein